MMKELHNFYSSPNIIRATKSRKMGWAGQRALMKEMRNTYKILVENSFGRPSLRWKDSIKIHLQGIRREDMDRNQLAQDRDQWRALVNTVMNLHVPQGWGILADQLSDYQFLKIYSVPWS
jgi:hypothetical protein